MNIPSIRLSGLKSLALAALLAMGLQLQPAQGVEGASTQYTVTPVPTWVAAVRPNPTQSDLDAVGGARHLLLDRQSRYDGKSVAYHQHSVTEVTGQAGLSDTSKLSISFDPAYQRLELHSATVLRQGQESDRLAHARITVAQTENDSSRDLLYGELTALVVLPDVRVGDQVETRYTIFGRNPVFDSRHHSRWLTRWGVPVERSVLRITVPESMTLSHSKSTDAVVTSELSGGLRTLQWHWDSLTSSEAERNVPDDHLDPDLLQVSAYKSWREVADWGADLFSGHSSEGDAYKKLSKAIVDTADAEGLPAAIAMAIDHVQKQIRYYGIELGENSHRPHAPDDVLRRGYGDCKDKALLLVSLLQDLGVDAWPILVSMRNRGGIAYQLPSPGAFDHVVVLIEQDGEQYWVDATDNRQSGLLGLRGQPEYGAGVVLGNPDMSLIRRDAPVPAEPTSITHDKFYLSSMGGPVDFETSTVYRGREANRFRRNLDETGKRRLHKSYEDFYRKWYGDLHPTGSLQVDENTRNNTITVTERYRLNGFWTVNKRSEDAHFDVYAINVRNALLEPPKVSRQRQAPVRMRGPTRVAHRIQFFPNVASSERPLEQGSFAFGGFEYRDSEYVLGNSLVFDSELTVSTDRLDASQLDEYKRFYDRVMRRAQGGRYYRQIDTNAFRVGEQTADLLSELRGLHQ